MKYLPLAAVLAVLVFAGFGCRLPDPVISTSTTTSVVEHPFVGLPPDDVAKSLSFNLEGGSMPALIDRDPSWILPDEIKPDQFRDAYRVTDNVIFGLILRPNANENIPDARPDSYGGVILTRDGGKTWSPLLFAPTSSDTNGLVIFNPIGFSIERKREVNSYVADFADDRGAGSGEGNLVRYRTVNGKDWKRDPACFYYGGTNYFLSLSDPEKRDQIRAPFDLEKMTCPAYVHN